MDPLGAYRELPEPALWIGDVVFLVSLATTGLLERLQFRLRANEQRR